MVNICGINVDLDNEATDLSRTMAIYIIEFESDCRLLVCHTLTQTVGECLEKLIRRTLGPNCKDPELRIAFLNSEHITLSVKNYGLSTASDVLSCKYDLIKREELYRPNGYNSLVNINDYTEQKYANVVLQQLLEKIDSEAKYKPYSCNASSLRRGRPNRSVYAYDKISGILVKGYNSLNEASETTGVKASNISACCSGHLKSAGLYIWSYTYLPVLGAENIDKEIECSNLN